MSNRPRLNHDTAEPGFLLLLLQLSNDTYIDPLALANFVRVNLGWLRPSFRVSGESETHQRVENCPAIWIRQQFKRHKVVA